ncbi:DUF397 domain-containing protein [Embleya sp. AB8]|uniref:DUF397 domain-containing protein n=1 Tax=Embleya sp. AB8 TaxID=3156304 RepID=UPI003C77A36C
MTAGIWFKSSYSLPNNDCVEGSHSPDDTISIRDSKAPDQGIFRFPGPIWTPFLAALKTNEPPSQSS